MEQVVNSERSGNTIPIINKKISTSSTGGSQERPVKYSIKHTVVNKQANVGRINQ